MFARGSQLGLRTFLLSLAAVVLMLVDQQTAYFAPVRSVLTIVVSPLQYIIDAPINFVVWLGSGIQSHNDLVHENARLQAEQLLLNAQLQKLLAVQSENQQLRGLQSRLPHEGIDRLSIAQVLAVSSAPYLQEIIIDQGSQVGVFVGQPILDADGVMGQVISVAPFLARVMLLSDTRSAIPVEDVRNQLRGIVIGQGSYSNLSLINMPITTDIKVGDALVTSGLGLRYPKGYPVGVISNIQHPYGQAFLAVSVQPSAQFDRTRLVMLVWPDQVKLLQQAQQELVAMQTEGKTTVSTTLRARGLS